MACVTLQQIKLQRLSAETGCTIVGKAEFQNPGGSVKDRAALYVVKDAEEKGRYAALGPLCNPLPPAKKLNL